MLRLRKKSGAVLWLEFDQRDRAFPRKEAEKTTASSSSEIVLVERSGSANNNTWFSLENGLSFYQHLLNNSGEHNALETPVMLGVVNQLLESAHEQYMSDTSIADLPDDEVKNIAVKTFNDIIHTLGNTLYEHLHFRMDTEGKDYGKTIAATATEIASSSDNYELLQTAWNKLNQLLALDGVNRSFAYYSAKNVLINLREVMAEIAPDLKRELETASDPLSHFGLGDDPKVQMELMERVLRHAKREHIPCLLAAFESFGWKIPRLLKTSLNML